MTRMQKLFMALAVASLSLIPSLASAQTVKFVGVGSSALWQTAGIAAWEATGKHHHYTFKLTGAGVGVVDNRNTTAIAPAQGSLFIVWDNASPANIYAGVNLDSTVGNRLFLGTVTVAGANVPTGTLVLPAVIPAAAGLISTTLWNADDTTLPTAISTALHNARVTAALTDIRPEDGAFQTARVSATLGASVNDGAHSHAGLGYTGALSSTPTVTNWIKSTYSTAAFQVVKFNTHGTDPYTSATVPSFTSVRVGISPIVLIGDRGNTSGLGAKNSGGHFYFTNMTAAEVQSLWDGTTDNSSVFAIAGAPSVPLTVNLREPLSGTYNTFEYQALEAPYNAVLANQISQEKGVNPSNSGGNPLSLTSTNGGGSRKRAIGTGEMVGTAVLGHNDSLGYTFFSTGNISKIANNVSYGYYTVNGIDPINPSYVSGLLPAASGSPLLGTLTYAPSTPTFTHVNDGTYPIWSDLRIVTYNYGAVGSPTQSDIATATALATQIGSDITKGSQYPDFVPFASAKVYRSHYSNGTYTNGSPSNGLGGAVENGSDVNGCVEVGTVAPGILNCRR